jgi:F-type H+-transporting ATPase subunit delta
VLEGADASFRNFVLLVAEKGRIDELPEIHEEWERLLAAEERILSVELTTAVELTDEEAAEIVQRIEEAAGRRVEATRKVEPDLIGGLVLRAGSMRVDGSVRGRSRRCVTSSSPRGSGYSLRRVSSARRRVATGPVRGAA